MCCSGAQSAKPERVQVYFKCDQAVLRHVDLGRLPEGRRRKGSQCEKEEGSTSLRLLDLPRVQMVVIEPEAYTHRPDFRTRKPPLQTIQQVALGLRCLRIRIVTHPTRKIGRASWRERECQ